MVEKSLQISQKKKKVVYHKNLTEYINLVSTSSSATIKKNYRLELMVYKNKSFKRVWCMTK